LAVTALAVISAELSAQNRYRIRKLRCEGLAHGVAWSIADDGTVVGEMLDTAGRPHAVRWREGAGAQSAGEQLAGAGGSEVGVAYWTGTAGAIAGATGLGLSRTSATVWLPGDGEGLRAVDLGALTGSFGSAALAVGHDRAVGFVDDGLQGTPMLWDDLSSKPTPMALPMPAWAFAGEAVAMLHAEAAVGFVADFGSVQPVVWRLAGAQPKLHVLPTAGGQGMVQAARGGTAVGVLWPPLSGRAHLATWTDGELDDLGNLPGTDCYGRAVNRRGDVVGYARTYSLPAYVGVLKLRGQPVVDLNGLLPPNSGWTIARALDISDDGVIIGTGVFDGFYEPFVMVPEGVALAAPAPGIAGANNEITVDGASPLGSVIHCVALMSGNAPVPGCDARLDLDSPLVFGVIEADTSGRASFPVFVPAVLRGIPLRFQAFDHSICEPSNVVPFAFR
jgi:uncharacterized membrane protein